MEDDDTMEQTNNDSENSIDNSTKNETNINTKTKYLIKKKVDDKKDKKAFNVYMPDDLVKELDKISKKSGYSRNELIVMMCQDCISNYEIIE